MTAVLCIGRIIFGFYWLMNAYNHLVNGHHMIGYAEMKGVRSPRAAIYGAGILLLVGGLSMLLGISPKVGVILLVIFLLGVSFKMHAYWQVSDPMMKMAERVNFMKNMALIGALLMIAAIPTPWPASLGW